MNMKAVGVIPARLGSTRLAQKVLLPLNGVPMIVHVWKRACLAKKLSDVIVACDDAAIEACVRQAGGKAVMTRRDHPNGTSRVAEAAAKLDAEVLINVQGDEPLLDPRNIDGLVKAVEDHPETRVATIGVRKTDREEFENPNVVKVVSDRAGNALYFSRSPVPFFRDTGSVFSYVKHLGIYGYRKDFLLEFVTWEISKLEEIEKLEQLRILERGIPLRVVESTFDSMSVDTSEDALAVEKALRGAGQSKNN